MAQKPVKINRWEVGEKGRTGGMYLQTMNIVQADVRSEGR